MTTACFVLCGAEQAVDKDLVSFPVRLGELVVKKSWKGAVEAEERRELVALNNLVIKEIKVSEGQTVKKGDPLIIIDKEAAGKKFNELKTALELLKLDYQNLELDAKQKEGDYHNKKILLEKNVIAQKIFAQAESAYLVAKNTLQGKKIDLDKQNKQVEDAQKDMDSLDYLAPIDGVISGLIAADQVGLPINAQTKLATVSQLDRFIFRIKVEDTFVHQLSVGGVARITLDNFPDKQFVGKIAGVGMQPISTGDFTLINRYDVTIKIDSEPTLKEQLTGEAEVIFAQKEKALTIPLAAVTSIGGESFVLTSKDAASPINQQKVELGIKTASEVEVISGLESGALVWKKNEAVQ